MSTARTKTFRGKIKIKLKTIDTYFDGVFLTAKLLVVLQIERRTMHLTRDGSNGFAEFVDAGHEIRPTHVVGEVRCERGRFLCLEVDELPL